MDDSQPRHADGGGATKPQDLRPVTILAEPTENPAEAAENWARGLDWVEWLFSSIRQCMDGIYAENATWQAFAADGARRIGTDLVLAWRAATEGDMASLLQLDHALESRLTPQERRRSIRAGERLLRGTRGARYQGFLGRFRVLCEEGKSPGHFLTVWAAVAHFFQLSLTNVIAEWVRLERAMAVRSDRSGGVKEIAEVTAAILQESAGDLQLLSHTAPTTATGTIPV